MAKFDHFNFLGPIYDLIFGRSNNHEIVHLAAVNEGHRVLDVGGGTGRISVLLKKRTTNVFIADSAMKMIRQAQEKGIHSVNSVSEKLPFQDSSFDRIVMVDAFHHVENQEMSLKEMWRLLARGGLIIIEEPNVHNMFVKMIAIGEKLLLMRSHFVSPEHIAAWFRNIPQAKTTMKIGKGIAWIIVSKQ